HGRGSGSPVRCRGCSRPRRAGHLWPPRVPVGRAGPSSRGSRAPGCRSRPRPHGCTGKGANANRGRRSSRSSRVLEPWRHGAAPGRTPTRGTSPRATAVALGRATRVRGTPPAATRGRVDRAGRRRRGASYCLLQGEQGVLGVEPAEVATQAAVGAKHPVAGHHDREGVGGAGGADRTDRSWISDQGGDLLVGQGVAVTDAWQIPLHTLSEPCRQGVVQ